MLRQKYAAQNHNLLIANESSENVAKFRYLGRIVTNQNRIQEDINSYHSVQYTLSARIVSKTLKNYNDRKRGREETIRKIYTSMGG